MICEVLGGKYRIDQQFGAGGMGTVYLVTHHAAGCGQGHCAQVGGGSAALQSASVRVRIGEIDVRL
jgi:hypothetical protein